MQGPVVVGVDGTADALRAVRWAAVRAGLRDVGLRLVHASSSRDGVLRIARDVADETVGGLPVTVVTGELPPAELLVRESTGASLVVLGHRGHGGFSRLLIGATAVTVAVRARCPMVVMCGPDEPGSGVIRDRDRVEEAMAELLAGHRAHYPDVKVVREVVADTPGRALLDRAASAQLAVVGSGRRIGYRGALLRSTSRYLLHHAPCPVAVVRRDHPI